LIAGLPIEAAVILSASRGHRANALICKEPACASELARRMQYP
jgi:hypothetical protein